MAPQLPPLSAKAVLASVCVALLTTVLWSIIDWIWWRPKKLERILRQQGLAGTSYRLYYGDLRDASRMLSETKSKPMDEFTNSFTHRVRPFSHQLLKKYGKTFFFWEGPVPVINIGDPQLIREVFNRYNEFQKPKSNPIVNRSFLRGVAFCEGHKWAQHRKLINPAFHMEKLKLMLPSIYTSCKEVITEWENMLSSYKEGTEKKLQLEIDVCQHIQNLSADAISRAAFGSSYNEGKRIFELIKELMTVAVRITQSVYFPGRRFLPFEDNKKIQAVNRQIKTLLTGIIDKRIRENKHSSNKDDLLGLLMAATSLEFDQKETIENRKNQKVAPMLTTDELIEECKLFYLAGQETTSNLLTWTMIILSKHQEWQTRAREEVRATFGDNDPDFAGLNHLKIMSMILHEVLRLYSPVAELRRSVNTGPIKLGKLTIPSKVMVNLPITFSHHDPDQWGKDAEEFNPERFAEGISKAAPNKEAAFIPFGWGPRICLGLNFSMVEAKLAMSMILQKFSFELSPTYVHAPTHMGFLCPLFGAPILLNRL